MDSKEAVKKMTVDQKARLLSGVDSWYTAEIKEFDIPAVRMSDGPYGLRKADATVELNNAVPATCFPPLCTLANTFDTSLALEMGKAIGEECQENNVNIILGPGVNIKRNPLCGRNFEYLSEDPYLAGKMGTSYVNGVQSSGTGVSLKHYCCNNEEDYRFFSDSNVDERALREIYLKPFEMVIKAANPTTVMVSYNKVNGTTATANKRLLIDIARNEWSYNGVFVSDWGAVSSRRDALLNGLDLEMPGQIKHHQEDLLKSYENGTLDLGAMDRSCSKIIDMARKLRDAHKKDFKADKEAHHSLSVRIAESGAVLLKNQDNALPLNKNEQICIIGRLADKMRFEGGGSSHVNAIHVVTPLEALKGYGIFPYAEGYRTVDDEPDEEKENKALELAKGSSKIIFFAGLTDLCESEGMDRTDLNLPKNQLTLLNKLTELEKPIVVVLFNGSPVELPFESKVKAILDMYLPGQGGGTAVADLLFGAVSPSGKLAETWPKHLEDSPSYPYFNKRQDVIEYRESIYVGYRYYDKARVEPMYPFGYGLSYSAFEYSDLEIAENASSTVISFKVKNIGDIDASETAQLYVGHDDTEIFKAPKELKRFFKVHLQPGEEKDIMFELTNEDFAYYNVKARKMAAETGIYSILIGASSADIRLSKKIKVNAHSDLPGAYDPVLIPSYFSPTSNKFPPEQFEALLGHKVNQPRDRLPITMESPINDFQLTRGGRFIYKIIKKNLKKAKKKAIGSAKTENAKEAAIVNSDLMTRMIKNETMYNAVGVVGDRLTYEMGEGIIEIANNHFFRGLFKLIFKK